MSYLGKVDQRTARPIGALSLGQTIGNLIAGGFEQQPNPSDQNGGGLLGSIEHGIGSFIHGVEQVGGAILNGVESVGGAIVNGVETAATDVGNFVEGLVNPAPAATGQAGTLPTGTPDQVVGGPGAAWRNQYGWALTDAKTASVPWSQFAGMTPGQLWDAAAAMHFNPSLPIYIGGGGDGYSLGQFDVVKDYVHGLNGGGNFFTNYQGAEVDAAIDIQNRLGFPVILVGHSWGASTALDAAYNAEQSGIPIRLLATIDPVTGGDSTIYRGNIGAFDRNLGGTWVDVRATAYETSPDESDKVASIGVRMNTALQSQADVPLTLDFHHADFKPMMITAGIPAMIKSVQSSYPRPTK